MAAATPAFADPSLGLASGTTSSSVTSLFPATSGQLSTSGATTYSISPTGTFQVAGGTPDLGTTTTTSSGGISTFSASGSTLSTSGSSGYTTLASDVNYTLSGSTTASTGTWSDGVEALGAMATDGGLTTAGVQAASMDAAATPEPATLALFGAGLAGVSAMARRRRARGVPSEPAA